MKRTCAVVNNNDVQNLNNSLNKNTLNKLKALNISTEGLTKEETIAIVSNLMTEKGYTQDTIMNLLTTQNKRLLNDAISNARIKKMKEQEALKSTKIGNAEFVVGERVDKGKPRERKDILYIFADNLQASNTVFGEQIGETIEVAGGPKLNVKSSSALMRTDINGDLNQNVVGLVTKKNAQNKDGIFIAEEGYFQDTNEDFAAFEAANKRAINKIKDLIFEENSPYTKISMVGELATEKASLPERFADKLADMLEEELGIYTQKVANKNGFGLKVMKLGKSKKVSAKKKEAAIKEVSKKIDSFIESLQKERPKLDSIKIDPEDRSILAKTFPSIEERMASVALISDAFSRYLTKHINSLRDYYAKKENRTKEEESYYRGLIRGTEAQQRVFALGTFTRNGEPLGSYILNEIRRDLEAIRDACLTQEGRDGLVRDLLLGKGLLGMQFLEELQSKNIQRTSDSALRYANNRVIHLGRAYNKMLNDDVFNALCRDAAIELEFTENIRFNYKTLPISTEEDTGNLEEDKENANKEGYMVKYKLLDPAKSLSIRMKTLLGSIYKRSYKDSSQYVFDNLGNKVRMDALTAYRILLDEFSTMKNPDQFAAVLDRAIQKYTWLGSIKDKLVFNPENPKEFNEDIRNEFYTTMRRAQVPCGMVSERGLLKRLNRSNSADSLLDNITGNYEGRVVLGKNSIYTETGEANIDNCILIHKLFSNAYTRREDRIVGSGAEARQQKQYSSYKNQPLGWALTQLTNFKVNKSTVDNVKTAIKILLGYNEDHKHINLEKILRNIGIDTNRIDIDSLFGDFPFLTQEELDDIKTLDDLGEHISKDQINRIISTLNSIAIIVNQTGNKRFQAKDHLVAKFQSAYLAISSALSIATDGYTAMTFRHNGTTRASYTMPDYISDLIDIVNNVENIEEANRWLEENYGKFDFFKDPVTKEWVNTWLKDFFDPGPDGDYPFRRNFEYINVLSFMGSDDEHSIGKIEKGALMAGIIHAFLSANKDNYGNSYGYYRCPLFSDVDSCVLIKGRRYTGEGYQDTILNNLVKVLLQEVNRINSIKSSKNKNTTKIEYYNSGKNNGEKFQYFPELNSQAERIEEICTIRPGESPVEFVNRRDKELKELLRESVNKKAARFLEAMKDSDKLALYKRIAANEARSSSFATEENTTVLLEEEENDAPIKQDEQERNLKRINELLTEFYYNDYFAQSQIQQLIGGDLAYYKNYIDYVKRNKQAYACGERLFARKTDEQGNIVGNLTETVIYMEDEDVMTNSYEGLQALLENSSINESDRNIINFALDSFKKINSTDGQTLRTLDSFKTIFKAKGGIWTSDMEEAYQNIKNNTITAKDFLSLWNSIKPFYYGHESIEINGRNEKVTTQHKNSEYMITALFSFLNTALNKSPKLQGLHEFMVKNNIDAVHFHSVVKEGYNSPFSLTYNKDKFDRMSEKGEIKLFGEPFNGTFKEYMDSLQKALIEGAISQKEFTEAKKQFEYKTSKEVLESLEKQSRDSNGQIKDVMFKKFPMDSYMIVQPSDDHLIDAEAIFGTQLKNIIMADLPSDFSITIVLNGKEKTLNREEAVKFYNTLIVDNLLDAFSKISEEFGSIKSLQAALFAKMRNNPKYGDDVKAALQINKSGTGFVLPFNSPTLSNKIEELILSTFKNAIQRQKIKGGNAILASNFGLHDDLHVVYKDGDKNKGIQYIEAYLPAYSSHMFKDFLVQKGDYMEIDFEKMQKHFKDTGASELLDIIGYRIPTEDKYSIIPIRIKGFMPVIAGSTIMLPTDIITMSGTDFDIDKLFLMVKEFDRITYSRDLKTEFEKWLNANKEEGNSRTIKALKKGLAEGYTDEKINSLIKHDDVFADFMDEVGYKKRYKVPLYKAIKPDTIVDGRELSLDKISKQEHLSPSRRRAIRNNLLIDLMNQTLKNEQVSSLLMQPGNYARVKHSSRQQKIMHNPKALKEFLENYKDLIEEQGLFTVMDNMSTEQLEDFYEKNAEPIDPLDVLDYVDLQKNLMDGNALIGIFAVNSSNHYKLQFCPLEIAKELQITIEGVTFTHIDLQNSPITGERIGRINAEFQAASPDNGKDPCLGDIGANSNTANRIGLLARLGLKPEIIGLLNTCDDFVKYCRGANRAIKSGSSFKTFDLRINQLAYLIALYRTDTQAFNDAMQIPENALFIDQFIRLMDAVETMASSLGEVSKVSRSDSPNGSLAVNIPEVIQQYFGIQDFTKKATAPNAPIKGLDKLVNTRLDLAYMSEEELRSAILETPVPRLQAAYTLGIKSALSLCSDLFPSLSPAALRSVELLRTQTQRTLTGKKYTTTIRKFVAEMTAAILSKNSIFASDEAGTLMDKRNYYIHDFPMKFKAFKEKKNDKGHLAYPEVVNLDIIQKITNISGKGLKFKSVGGVSERARKHFVEELESLLYSDKEEVRELAVDLFMYSYYDNGFQFGHSNFGIFFTTVFLKNIPKFVEALNIGNARLMNEDFNSLNFVLQFMMNHPELSVKIYKDQYIMDGDKLIPTNKGLSKLYTGSLSTNEYVMLVQAAGHLWIQKTDGDNVYYTKIEYNKTKIPYYDMSTNFDEIKYSDLKDRGQVGYVTAKKLNAAEAKATSTNQKNEVNEENIKEIEETPEKNIEDPGVQDSKDPDFINIPQDEELDERLIPKDDEGEPTNLQEQARKATELESKLESLAQKVSQLEKQLMGEPEEINEDFLNSEDPIGLEKFIPTNDPDVKMCE